jgi:hypothetical protein
MVSILVLFFKGMMLSSSQFHILNKSMPYIALGFVNLQLLFVI